MRVLHNEVAVQDAGIAEVFEDRRVDLHVLLQPRVSGKLKEHGDGNYAFGVLWSGTLLHVFAGAHNWATCGG